MVKRFLKKPRSVPREQSSQIWFRNEMVQQQTLGLNLVLVDQHPLQQGLPPRVVESEQELSGDYTPWSTLTPTTSYSHNHPAIARVACPPQQIITRLRNLPHFFYSIQEKGAATPFLPLHRARQGQEEAEWEQCQAPGQTPASWAGWSWSLCLARDLAQHPRNQTTPRCRTAPRTMLWRLEGVRRDCNHQPRRKAIITTTIIIADLADWQKLKQFVF